MTFKVGMGGRKRAQNKFELGCISPFLKAPVAHESRESGSGGALTAIICLQSAQSFNAYGQILRAEQGLGLCHACSRFLAHRPLILSNV